MIKLIVSADDFGYSYYFNKMILELLEEGFVTSTSVMIESTNASQADQVKTLKFLADKQPISVGLHVNFKTVEFEQEVEQQFQRFIEMFGFTPSHVDIHQPDDLKKEYTVIQKFCLQKGLSCRNLSFLEADIMLENVFSTKEPAFEGTKKTFDEIQSWICGLKEGIYEIVFHPGYYDPDSMSILNKEHEREKDAKHIKKIFSLYRDRNIERANYYDLVKQN